MRKLFVTLLFPIFIFSQGWNTELIGNLEYSQELNDVWGYTANDGNEYALVGTETGTSIVRVNEGLSGLQEVAFIPGDNSIWRDIKTYGHYMYVGTEASQGIQVVDIEDPENAELVYTWTGITNSHDIFQADGYLYVVGASGYDVHILDLSNPAQPEEIGGWNGEYIHDLYVRGDYAYAAGIYSSTMYIIDISDKTNPQTVTSWSYSGAAHACWLTEDGNYLITADETTGGNVKIWDIQDFNNINMISQWTVDGGEDKSIHNVLVRDQYLYISYYIFGLQILDISDPYNPTPAGYYDTYPGSNGFYNGAWGAYPFTESCYTYVSDIESGLYVVDFVGCNSATAELSYSPGSFNFSLNTDQSSSEILTITNSGESESVMFYDVSIAIPSPFENSGGGPDGFGHFWSDSDLESSIDYEWIEISDDTNTQQVSFPSNDGGTNSINIDFDFPFYEDSYSECIVNANGWLGFGENNTEWSNTSIPSESAPRPAIFGFWDDLNPVNDNCNQYCSGNVYVNSNSDRFVVWFDQVAHWWTGFENSFYDFQIVLYPNGEIQLNYREITGTHAATIGIQDESGTVGLQVAYNNDYVHNNLSVKLIKSESADWLEISSENNELNGQLIAGETLEVIVSADALGMEAGMYGADIILNTNTNPNIEIPVSITIEDNSPDLTLNISNMDGWNMIGLPLNVEDSNYQSIFPDAIHGTLFLFNDGYLEEENLESGNGYWLRFNEDGVTSISGLEIESITLEITEGWNLISGISSSVQISEIEDADQLIISGTVYGFSLSGYVNADMLEPGYGYWLRSSGNGNIVVSNSGTASNRIVTNSTLENAHSIAMNGQQLYFGVSIPEEEILQYSLPPKPPVGAIDFRFKGGWKYCEEDCEIEISTKTEFLTFAYNLKTDEIWNLSSSDGKNYELKGTSEVSILSEERFILSKNTELPITFALNQNYPNPFNPTTNIRYSIELYGHVNLTIYDLNGRKVQQLVNESQSAGNKTIIWNGKDEFGKPVSAGVYLYKIQADKFIETRKMILMK